MNRKTILIILTVLVTGFLIGVAYATTFSFTYDTETPAGSDDPAEADDRMREIKAALQERLAVEHVFALTGTEVSASDTGKHSAINPTSVTSSGAISGTTGSFSGTLDVTGNIDPTTYETTNGGFLDEDDMASDADDKVASQQSIKTYADASPKAQMKADNVSGATFGAGTESCTLANGMIIKRGTSNSIPGDSTGAVTFGDNFPGGILTVTTTVNTTGTGDATGNASVSGGHLSTTVALQDIIERETATTFRLVGRGSDIVNIAGKRGSLADLNIKLRQVEGVEDGVFVMPGDGKGATTRLTALVIAPGMSAAEVMAGLETQMDAAFLPRPIYLVEALPYNELGKLPRRELQAWIERSNPDTP